MSIPLTTAFKRPAVRKVLLPFKLSVALIAVVAFSSMGG